MDEAGAAPPAHLRRRARARRRPSRRLRAPAANRRCFTKGRSSAARAPDFSLALVANGAALGGDGNAVTMRQLRGRAVLLDFWATWCPPCRVEAPIVDQSRAPLARQGRRRGGRRHRRARSGRSARVRARRGPHVPHRPRRRRARPRASTTSPTFRRSWSSREAGRSSPSASGSPTTRRSSGSFVGATADSSRTRPLVFERDEVTLPAGLVHSDAELRRRGRRRAGRRSSRLPGRRTRPPGPRAGARRSSRSAPRRPDRASPPRRRCRRARPPRRAGRRRRRRWRTSRNAAGSSSRSTRGLCASARAIETRRCSPPLSVSTGRAARAARSQRAMASSMASRSSGVSRIQVPWCGALPIATTSRT